MDWLLQQAQTASPFVAVFCLTALGIVVPLLWRQHIKDQVTILAITKEGNEAMLAISVSMERLAGAFRSAKGAARSKRG